MVESIVQDVRRSVRARPGQSLLLAGMISLGVAASSSTFAIVDQVLLRPVPGVVDSESLATLGVSTASDRSQMIAIRDAAVLRDAAVVDGLAGYRGAYLSLLPDGYGPIGARGVYVYGDYFDLLGVRPIRGRLLSGGDQQPNEIVISEHLWTQSFGASDEIVGMSIRADGAAGGGVFTVVGVAAGPFRGSQQFWEVDYWIPIQAMPVVGRFPEEMFYAADAGILQFLIARPTADRDAVASVLTRTLRETSARAELREAKVGVTSGLADPETAQFLRAAVGILFGMIGLVFLLPTLNVAGILSIRLIRDRRNEQVRLALGATASQRLLANAFEGALVGALAGGAGLWASDVLSALYRGQTFILGVPLTGPVRSPLTGMALILIVSLGVAALFTLIGWSARRHAGWQTVSRSGSQSSVRIGRGLPAVAALQLALIVPLLVGGALMLRTLQEMAKLQPGFSVDNLYSVDVPLSLSAPDEPGRSAQASSILTVRGATGGAATALMGFGPYENSRPSAQVRVVGSSQPPIASEFDWATGDWLAALDVEVVEGRGFSEGVLDGDEAEAIVTRALARELFTGSAIGQRIEISIAQDHTARIVGVIPDLRIKDPRASSAKLVVTSEQVSYLQTSPALLARPVGPARETLVGLQDEVTQALPMLPLGEFRPVSEMARDLIAEQTVLAKLLLVIGVAGVGVALTGLYAVMTFVAEVRRREFGIRMALGASPHRIVGHAASSVSRVVVSGMVVGALLTPIMIVGLRSRLVGVAPLDPTAIGASAFVLLLVAVAAGLNPARRAISVDPVVELRAD